LLDMAQFMDRALRMASTVGQRLNRSPLKEACAEFLGTFVLVFLGDSVMAACTLGHLGSHSVLAGAFGWGLALMIAVAITGGVSGGHVNPAVTLGLATARKCEWKHVLPNMAAQYLSSLLAASAVYLTYRDAINQHDGGWRQVPPAQNATAQIFATYPQDYSTMITCIWDQVIGTAMLLIVICAATDSRNLRVPPHSQPMLIGLGLTAIALALGHNCGAPLNPARDLAPRLFTASWGWGLGVFSFRNYQWFWIPVIAPYIGGILGVWIYKLMIEMQFTNYSSLQNDLETQDEIERCKFPSEINPVPIAQRHSLDHLAATNTLNRSAIADYDTLNEIKTVLPVPK